MGKAADPRAGVAAQCISDIEVADFVALDFEFSGLFVNVTDRRQLSIDEYFQKCIKSIPQFLPVQIGICCVLHKRGLPEGEWELRTHELNLWPQDRRIFCSDLQSLKFLRSHGFDFNTFLETGFTYSRLPKPEVPKNTTRQQLPYATQVMLALREAHVPIIVHNGLLDLLHLYDKFIDKLPEEREAFGNAWRCQFSLLFDTRLIAQEGRFQVLKVPGGLSVEDLHRQLTGLTTMHTRFQKGGPLGDSKGAHGSSGVDARMTAEVFLMEMEVWLRKEGSAKKRRRRAGSAADSEVDGASKSTSVDVTPATAEGAVSSSAPVLDQEGKSASGSDVNSKPAANDKPAADNAEEGWTVVSRKRRRDDDAAECGFTSPTLLESHEVCRRFHNRIAIVGASPGSMDLGRPPGLPTAFAAQVEEQPVSESAVRSGN